MNPSPIKQLIQLIGQAGGTVALSISDLRELGVEITLENICDDRQGRVVLRLGPKIYYIPDVQPQVQEEAQAPWPQEIETPKPQRTSSSAPRTPLVNQVNLEMEAVTRINNRPRPRKNSAELRREIEKRVRKQPPLVQVIGPDEQPLPYAKVGVHRLNDMELWLQEQVRAETRKTRERAARTTELRTGDLPFRTIPGR